MYSTVMVLIVASLLSFTATSLREIQNKNVEIEKKGNILQSVGLLNIEAGADKNLVIPAEYEKFITKAFLVNTKGEVVSNDAEEAFKVFVSLSKEMAKPLSEQRLPVFEARLENGETKYIFPVNGTGLWGPIWGYVALNSNLSTIFGVVFDHASETPGLGAEIATPKFMNQFIGKELFSGSTFKGITVVKGTAGSNLHEVDAVTGGTITSRAVEDMIRVSMSGYCEYIIKNQVK